MRRPKDKLIAGFDLHGNNVVIGIINQDGRRLEHKKVPTELPEVLRVIEPHKAQLISMAVESTFNWYWLVDGLRQAGYPIDLANPAKIEQYNGIKHVDDKHDAFFLAELQRLGILPKAYIYDVEQRPVRDLLRRRTMLVSHRTALFISFKSLYTRTTGALMPLTTLKSMEPEEGPKLYTHPANQLIAKIQLEQIAALDQSTAQIESAVLGDNPRWAPVFWSAGFTAWPISTGSVPARHPCRLAGIKRSWDAGEKERGDEHASIFRSSPNSHIRPTSGLSVLECSKYLH